MLELLSPAGSMEALKAAVQNGADAVYFGLGDFNARKNAKNLTDEDLPEAVSYCHTRGVKVYVTANTLVNDREMESAARFIQLVNDAGVDAVIVQDLGLAALIRRIAPQLPVHGSTQMSIHSLDGVRVCAAMGMERVVVSRELSHDQLKHICKNSPVEIEVFVHGALCMCYSGQCYMSSVIGRRSGNRGLCAQPCRLEYGFDGKADGHPLSLKDNCLAAYMQELDSMGVACIKIEGRMKRPEYVAITADVYSRAIASGTVPTNAELARMRAAFSRQGFTDGYYTGNKGPRMFGIREEGSEKDTQKLFAAARATYTRGERQQVPIRLLAAVRKDQPVTLIAQDNDGNRAIVQGPVPDKARTRAITEQTMTAQLEKTGGTPYKCEEVKTVIDPDLMLPLSALNALRRDALDQLTLQRSAVVQRPFAPYTAPFKPVNRKAEPEMTISISSAEQITGELAAASPSLLYIPLHVAVKNPDKMRIIADNPLITPAVVLPRIINDDDAARVDRQLQAASAMGIQQALVGNLGHIGMARSRGFAVRGDFGLNLFNSEALEVMAGIGALSACVSFELSLSQIRDLSKPLDTEMLAYGRLPLMVTENCVFKNKNGSCICENGAQLTDRTGARFPLTKDGESCRTVILNSQVLYLGDKYDEYSKLGLWAIRLAFTDETPQQMMKVISSYVNKDAPTPGEYTRGLYFRGTL